MSLEIEVHKAVTSNYFAVKAPVDAVRRRAEIARIKKILDSYDKALTGYLKEYLHNDGDIYDGVMLKKSERNTVSWKTVHDKVSTYLEEVLDVALVTEEFKSAELLSGIIRHIKEFVEEEKSVTSMDKFVEVEAGGESMDEEERS